MFGPFSMLLEVVFGERAQDKAGDQGKNAEITAMTLLAANPNLWDLPSLVSEF